MKWTIQHLTRLALVASLTLSMLIAPVYAASAGSVVINEVAWMGDLSDSSAEWIELYNNTNSDIDLAGWKIIDDETTEHTITAGIIPANGYFIIEADEIATSLPAGIILPLSLANSGDSLELVDDGGSSIDIVNSTGGAWFAGDNSNKLSMERIDPMVGGDSEDNWADSLAIEGSPGELNQQEPPPIPHIEILAPAQIAEGGGVTFTVGISDAMDAFAYGMDISYDPAVLQFVSASEGSFLEGNNTSFNAALENGNNGQSGLLVIGNAIIEDLISTSGVSGNGALLTMDFAVLGLEGVESAISFVPDTFLSDRNEEVIASFTGLTFTVAGSGGGSGGGTSGPVQNLLASLGEGQYAIDLTWDTPAYGAESYKILRKNQLGEMVEIAEVTANSFTDSDGLAVGGKLLPHIEYEYRVVAVKDGFSGDETIVSITETRGIKGDNNRSNRVDGRDLNDLAAHFGAELGVDDEYEALIDSTYDGFIDGSDLIDMAANWAVTYNF